jgi:hypothetical protein
MADKFLPQKSQPRPTPAARPVPTATAVPTTPTQSRLTQG